MGPASIPAWALLDPLQAPADLALGEKSTSIAGSYDEEMVIVDPKEKEKKKKNKRLINKNLFTLNKKMRRKNQNIINKKLLNLIKKQERKTKTNVYIFF